MAGSVGNRSLLPHSRKAHDAEVPPPRIAIVGFDGVQSLDVTGPYEVLTRGGQLAGRPYRVEFVAATAGTITASSGLVLRATRALHDVRGPLDTLVVAGGDGTAAAVHDRAFVDGIRRLAGRSRRVTSVCTGAFLLAEAGLLDGRRATTHWDSCDLLQRRYPAIDVDPAPIFVRDGDVLTSAGVTAGMDLALALVEEDHGAEVALATARRLVMYVQRPGGQAQFSAPLEAQSRGAAARRPIRDVQRWVAQHPGEDCSVDALARRATMSARHFARAFADEVGTTPARWVEEVRVEAARLLLETTDRTVDVVAAECGFGSSETLRRAFLRHLGVAPSDYRKRFRKEPA
jgi:transcriptional regulator GlxA family with amidase domain